MDFPEDIKILGFKANIESLDDFLANVNKIKKDNPQCTFQFIDASSVAGLNHVKHIINHSFLAFSRGENLANDLSVEIVLRASAQRQISKAFKMLGLKEGKLDICGIFINCSDEIIDYFSNMFERDDSVLLADTSKLQEVHNISSKELEVMDIEDILIDRTSKLIVDY